ncbi:OLC1v1020392C1 [Oldenlandia corymbosa var. corymbosa]|uniref:OLC1v1020392C1 n=1 Tax=Oldenlandia corymbosa var. corymbosa TaxID=529605 RepID=A0AAV1EGC5_OLDCO|nr:OLC1v1020392C1 [Oldenlandia corymbosa var. corymbosa]
MAFQCFEWIAHLIGLSPFFDRRVEVKQLPDDVIVDILSRLPAERVVECRRVCKRWRSLASSQYFIDLHLSRATAPSIFVHSFYNIRRGKEEFGFFFYDPTIKKKKVNKLRLCPGLLVSNMFTRFFDSCCGLMLITHCPGEIYWYVFNPLTQEKVSITCPLWGFVCGFFYHPVAKKFQILFRGSVGGCINYYVYTFGSPVWRCIKPPSFHYRPTLNSPAVYNGALYWIADWNYRNYNERPPCTCGVLVFDVIKEEFHVMPHPGGRCGDRSEHEYMSLLVGAEHLYFSNVLYWEKLIDIWILEDHSKWEWVRKWKLLLNIVPATFLEPDHTLKGYPLYNVKVVHIQDGQIWLDCAKEGLYLYRLDHHTLVKHKGTPPELYRSTEHRCKVLTKSLMSIRQLFMDEING